MTAEKMALCVHKTDVWFLGIAKSKEPRTYDWQDALFNLAPKMVPRAQCETDPSLLQLIPYILVVRESDSAVLCYERGTGGAEDRLHAKLSVGLGGHVDSLPGEHSSLYMHVLKEACRELEEEVGLIVDHSELTELCFVYEEETDVGRVHLGVVLLYAMTDMEMLDSFEPTQILNPRFVDPQYLLDNIDRFELWSQALIKETKRRMDLEEQEPNYVEVPIPPEQTK